MPHYGPEQVVFPAILALGVFFIGWYFVGNEIMRRRGRELALWCKRALDPLGGRQAVQWITMHSFRLQVDGLKAPFQSGSLTGLVESWDVPMIWLGNRLNGRRDMVLLQVSLRRQPIWGMELYRPRSVLAGDARRFAREEGWADEQLDEFRFASAGSGGALVGLAREFLVELGDERANLVRLSVRRQGPHLTLALNVPDRSGLTPAGFHQLMERLASATLKYATPAE